MTTLIVTNRKSNAFPLGWSVETRQDLPKVKLPNLAQIKAKKRADNSLELGYRLRHEAEKQNDFASLVDADLLILSGELESANHVTFENLFDKKGRRFEAPLQLVSLPTHLDNGFQRKKAYGSRKRIIERFDDPIVKEKIASKKLFAFLITPTYPNLVGKNLEENFVFIEEVARRFRDEDYYKDIIEGAYRKTEFTPGGGLERRKNHIAFDYRIYGYNFHNHYLCLSSIEFADTSRDCPKKCGGEKCGGNHIRNRDNKRNKKLAKLYTKIVTEVHFEMFGCELEIDTDSGFCVVDIRSIDLTDNGDGKDKGVFYEISKYLSKQNSLTELESKELLSANKFFRNKKLITSTGIFNNKTGRKKASNHSKSKDLQVTPLDKHPSSMFDKKSITGSVESASSMLKIKNNKPLKPLSLKQLGILMCESGNREKWLEELPVLFAEKVEKAKRKFLSRFPNSVITDLVGNTRAEYRKDRSESQMRLLSTVKASYQLTH